MYIKVYENNGRAETCAELLSRADLPSYIKGVELLPIPTRLYSPSFGDGGLFGLLDADCEGVVYAGYDIPPDFAMRVLEGGGILFDASLDEVFLQENAYLTSLGALGYILHSLCDTLEPRVGVVGYGRIGSHLSKMLLSLGVRVRVFTGRKATRLELGEMGVESSEYGEGADFTDLDLLVNTAPARTVVPPADLPVFDLASGDNFGGDMVRKLPALPAKLYPASAGKVWAEAIVRWFRRGGVE